MIRQNKNQKIQKFLEQKKLKIGARRSLLSRLQAYEVGYELKKIYPRINLEFIFTSSFGDRNLELTLRESKEKGVFTEDLRAGLKKGDFDLLVHSWKDLPTSIKDSNIFTLLRADQRDLFLVKKKNFKKLKEIQNIKIFTSSPRREFQIKEFINGGFFPFEIKDVAAIPIRGNVQTRIKKLMNSKKTDALIVAKAALDRLLIPLCNEDSLKEKTKAFSCFFSKTDQRELAKVQEEIRSCLRNSLWTLLPLRVFPTSPAQGALAIETLEKRENLRALLSPIHKPLISESVLKERKILEALGGGCHQNIGVSSLRRAYGRITYCRGDVSWNKKLNHFFKFLPKTKKLYKVTYKVSGKKIYEVLEVSGERKVNLKERIRFKSQPDQKETQRKVSDFYDEKVSRNKIFPLKPHQAKFFRREKIDLGVEFKSLKPFFWVSKEEALPKTWDQELKEERPVLWAAGVKTWKKLAGRGLWIHGCSESLGECEKEDIERLLGLNSISWVKMTHLNSSHFKGKKKCATYRLIPLSVIPNLKGKTHFYWQSESQFLLAIKKYPQIKKAFHASGPGHTFKAIERLIPKERRSIFLSHGAWKKVFSV